MWADDWTTGGTAYRKELSRVVHFYKLLDDHVWRSKGSVDFPDRAGPALFSQRERRGVVGMGLDAALGVVQRAVAYVE